MTADWCLVQQQQQQEPNMSDEWQLIDVLYKILQLLNTGNPDHHNRYFTDVFKCIYFKFR